MKTLVTGADGLLGSNLVRELIQKGFNVRVFIHPKSASRTLEGLELESVRGDILDGAAMEEAAKGCDSIFHVAASTAMWPPKDPKITAVNVEGTRNALDAAILNGARLVHVGSASSMGYGTKERPGDEESPYRYKGFGLAYFDSKLEAQKMVLRYVKEGRVDAVVVNPTYMIGAYDSGPSSGKLIVRYAEMKFPFYPPGGRCFAHVKDVAAGMIGALEKGRSGECYILGNRNLDMGEFFEIVANVAGFRPPKIMIPKEAMTIAGMAGTAIGDITKKAPEITVEMAKSSCIGSYYTAAKAVRELGLPQTPIEMAVEDAYRWLNDNGYIGRKRSR